MLLFIGSACYLCIYFIETVVSPMGPGIKKEKEKRKGKRGVVSRGCVGVWGVHIHLHPP